MVQVRKFKLGQEPSDLEYWLSKSPEERLAVVEVLHQRYLELVNDSVRTEFQRVYKIIKLSQN